MASKEEEKVASKDDEKVEDFGSLGLAPWIVRTCDEMGMKKPTPIQIACIPAILKEKRDVIGRAKTGSGKTAAFALPILHHLSIDPFGIFALVLTPTRELAFQIYEQFRVLGAPINIRTIVVCGGLSIAKQSRAIQTQPHIIIATPGRLADQIRTGAQFHFKHLQYLVLDEADRLLVDDFPKDIETINSVLPAKKQTLLFSATITKSLEGLQTMVSNDALFYEVSDSPFESVEKLEQKYLFVPDNVKEVYLAYVLQQEEWKDCSVIIFTATCQSCEVIAQLLRQLGCKCVSLHSRIAQRRRMTALDRFRGGKARILVATDVASRGLDIPTVQLVVNYDIPKQSEDYIHRVGRTARAGRGGLALSMVSQYDISRFQSIEKLIGIKLEEFPHNEKEVLASLRKVKEQKKLAELQLESDPTKQARDRKRFERDPKSGGANKKQKNDKTSENEEEQEDEEEE